MSSDSLFVSTLDSAVRAFNRIFDINSVSHGYAAQKLRWTCDESEGVQWNMWVDYETCTIHFGVNLEGLKYDCWPIAVFIEKELKNHKLLEFAANSPDSSRMLINFYRDAWKVRARPEISEKYIGGKGVNLGLLTEQKWREMLLEAYDCLDAKKGHRGRARQLVTMQNGEKRTMEVSPHIAIYLEINTETKIIDLETAMRESMEMLRPVYRILYEQSK